MSKVIMRVVEGRFMGVLHECEDGYKYVIYLVPSGADGATVDVSRCEVLDCEWGLNYEEAVAELRGRVLGS